MPKVHTPRSTTAIVKKMLVMMLGVSTPSGSRSASAGRAERASDASMKEAAKVVVVWGVRSSTRRLLAEAVTWMMVSQPTSSFEFIAIAFSFDAVATDNPPLIDADVVTRTFPCIICAGC